MAFKKALITGGAGFIGSSLALKLIDKGYSVTVLDNLLPQIHGDSETSYLYQRIKDKVNFIKGDVCNEADWEKAIADNEVIIHLAAETGTGQSMYAIQRYMNVNIGGTGIMLDFLANRPHSVKKVVVASSRAIYGEGKYWSVERDQPVYPLGREEKDMLNGDFEPKCPISGGRVELMATDENSKIHPNSIYGLTKYNQEQSILIACKALHIPAVAFRYQNVYGPGQSLKNPYTGILSIFSTRIKNNKGISVFEDGEESRDFVYIDDIVRATILGIEKEAANYKVFNVGSGVATTVTTVANTLAESYGIEVPIDVTGQFRLGDIRHNYADLAYIKKHLGFHPEITFSEGIKRFTNWVNEQEVESDGYEKSLEEMKSKGLLK
ncbi:MAG: NAD-dependent epimerase/dehydratase family protein [Bacteroidetes bacterium]|nr:NAD-dependent epimerase/dehydratase family protein [Bacteroidota bacterium]